MMRMSLLILSCLVSISCNAQSDFQALAGPFSLSRVIDGNTIELSSDYGTNVVELLGVVTADLHGEDPCAETYYHEANQFISDLLLNKDIWLEFDIIDTDDPELMFAYVYVADAQGSWLYEPYRYTQANEQLLLKGLAEPFFLESFMRYEDTFLRASQEARAKKLGIWYSAEACTLSSR